MFASPGHAAVIFLTPGNVFSRLGRVDEFLVFEHVDTNTLATKHIFGQLKSLILM